MLLMVHLCDIAMGHVSNETSSQDEKQTLYCILLKVVTFVIFSQFFWFRFFFNPFLNYRLTYSVILNTYY